ncbi:MAG: RsmE family RNA methyltransferase [Chloroherpetonaceae bacterium]|nr:RsmE family RNA methyltransferase [Chloroherpetonaceae bacterium]
MDIFFAPPEFCFINERRILLDEDESRHAVDVLRKKVGDEIICTNGRGSRFYCTIEEIRKHSLSASIVQIEEEPENTTKVSIAMSTLRVPDRFEFFLEKVTELGVTEIIPMLLERSVSRPKESKQQGKHERWERLIISAGKQSRRFHFPRLHPLTTLSQAIEMSQLADHRLFFDENHEGTSLLPQSFTNQHTFFIIGGEGGFSVEERSQILNSGFAPISLGKEILRAETAGIFAASLAKASELMSLHNPEIHRRHD